jgi:hypothetical protein
MDVELPKDIEARFPESNPFPHSLRSMTSTLKGKIKTDVLEL